MELKLRGLTEARLGAGRILSTLRKGTTQSVRHALGPESVSGTRDSHHSTEPSQVLGKITDSEPSYTLLAYFFCVGLHIGFSKFLQLDINDFMEGLLGVISIGDTHSRRIPGYGLC